MSSSRFSVLFVVLSFSLAPALALGAGGSSGGGGGKQRSSLHHCRIMKVPGYRRSLKSRIRGALRPLTAPKLRRAIRARGGLGGVVKHALSHNAVARAVQRARARPRARLHDATLQALSLARSSADRGAFRVSVLEVTPTKRAGHYVAKVAFLSKRSGGKTEGFIDVKVSYGRLGRLGRALGAKPSVSVVGRDQARSLRDVARFATGESFIAGQQTMIGISSALGGKR